MKWLVAAFSAFALSCATVVANRCDSEHFLTAISALDMSRSWAELSPSAFLTSWPDRLSSSSAGSMSRYSLAAP